MLFSLFNRTPLLLVYTPTVTADLSSLSFDQVHPFTVPSSLPPPPPPLLQSLNRLSVDGLIALTSTHPVPFPWSFLSASSLKYLTIAPALWIEEGRLLNHFILTVPHFHSLHLLYLPSRSDDHIFRTDIALSRIKLTRGEEEISRLVPFLNSFPPDQIKTWIIQTRTNGMKISSTISLFTGLLECAGLSNLSCFHYLDYYGGRHGNVLTAAGGKHVLRRWEERGVRIEFFKGRYS